MKTKTKFLIFTVSALTAGIVTPWTPKVAVNEATHVTPVPPKSSHCVKVEEGHGNYLGTFDCTEDIATVKKWAAYERNLKDTRSASQGTIKAVLTHYSRSNSCHNPKWVDGKRLCLTAIGQDTQEGVTVACPRNIKLGTKVEIQGHVYVCHDRYASYLDAKRGLPTFDVFYEDASPKPPGRQIAYVKIVD